MALVSSDRSSLIPAITQSERPQSWDNRTPVNFTPLQSKPPVAEQASRLSALCHSSEDLKPGSRGVSSCLQRGGKKKKIKLP